ncbi:hypothetical protein RF11_08617 [Thelohanellus kitauei]|uniref:Uncharacterized protein n=1 Tax=Thelohanellus kitauei TaxID=669202 RepID=A0A0C2MVP1_THEKT|nr:hypothetical protein RF11_08617 [Thelohanellus kitauei]
MSAIGTTAVLKVPKVQSTYISVCCATNRHCVVFQAINILPIIGKSIMGYIEQNKLVNTQCVAIMDHVRIHKAISHLSPPFTLSKPDRGGIFKIERLCEEPNAGE